MSSASPVVRFCATSMRNIPSASVLSSSAVAFRCMAAADSSCQARSWCKRVEVIWLDV
jgi:hypothetical protein